MTDRSAVLIRPLRNGHWKVDFPDGLTTLTVPEFGVALALVPTGYATHIIYRYDDEPQDLT